MVEVELLWVYSKMFNALLEINCWLRQQLSTLKRLSHQISFH